MNHSKARDHTQQIRLLYVCRRNFVYKTLCHCQNHNRMMIDKAPCKNYFAIHVLRQVHVSWFKLVSIASILLNRVGLMPQCNSGNLWDWGPPLTFSQPGVKIKIRPHLHFAFNKSENMCSLSSLNNCIVAYSGQFVSFVDRPVKTKQKLQSTVNMQRR